MKQTMFKIAAVLLLGGLFAFTTAPTWKILKPYTISFSGKGVDGVFKKMEAVILFDEKNLSTSKFVLNIDVNSFNTGNALQNKHSLGPEWFDAATYPHIRFSTTSIEKGVTGFIAKGKMEIKNKIKEMAIPFNFNLSGTKGNFSANFVIKRLDFGVGEINNDVADEIKVKIDVAVEK